MGMMKEAWADLQEQQAADDWYRYEMERDEALERRRAIISRAWQLHRSGMKIRKFFPEVGEVNIQIAAQFRAEAREIRSHWR
jgi:hypothetical protein